MGGLRILLVEDDPEVQLVFSEYLQCAGHTVCVARHGEDALHLLTNDFRPQIILLDIAMPVMDGITFLGRKQRVPALQSIPVVVISATAEPPIDGACCVLRKPVEPTDLMAAVLQYTATGAS